MCVGFVVKVLVNLSLGDNYKLLKSLCSNVTFLSEKIVNYLEAF